MNGGGGGVRGGLVSWVHPVVGSVSSFMRPSFLQKRPEGSVDPGKRYGTALPPAGPGEEEILARYWLKPGFSYASITESRECTMVYKVYEPLVDDRERILLEEINDYMRDTLVYDRVEGTESRVLDEEAVRRG
ncbi:MAG: hypothetical protein LUQ25_03630, partial [Methanoregulaceae archaeon]|nr:hypothetical protein [Methanoregulaceae archaeon]